MQNHQNQNPFVDIIIPTHNRAHLIETAVKAALEQSWWNSQITVVDDGSQDDTERVLSPYFDRADFNYIRLGRNLGTAGAKNAGLLLTNGGAVTFHDSDDIPHRDKVLRQVRAMAREGMRADACLNWSLIGREPGAELRIDAVLSRHDLILPDGRRVEIARELSLLDDVFPNLQMGAEVPGDWTHINSGLFRHDLFAKLGGFEDCIEEDREFRNRLILNGAVIWMIRAPLMTKIEHADSLTQSTESDYDSARRKEDRQMVWTKVDTWRQSGRIKPVPLDLPGLAVDFVSNPAVLTLRDVPMTESTRKIARDIWGQHGCNQTSRPREAAE